MEIGYVIVVFNLLAALIYVASIRLSKARRREPYIMRERYKRDEI
jgi:hypothetical protein